MTTDPYDLGQPDTETPAPAEDHAPTVEERLDKLEAVMAAFLQDDTEGIERVIRL